MIPTNGTTPFGDQYRTEPNHHLSTSGPEWPVSTVYLQGATIGSGTRREQINVGEIRWLPLFNVYQQCTAHGGSVGRAHADPGAVIDEMILRAGHARRSY